MTGKLRACARVIPLTITVACAYNVVDFAVPAPAPSDAAATTSGSPVPLPEPPRPLACPGRRPDENSPCVLEGRTCEYGAHADLRCTARLTCAGGAWRSEPPLRCNTMCPDVDAGLPALAGQPCSASDVDGGSFDVEDVTCPVFGGYCTCTTGLGGRNEHARMWICYGANVMACPTERPRIGQPCTFQDGCDYGSCVYRGGAMMTCLDSVWTTRGAQCE